LNTKGIFRERVSDHPGVYRVIAVRKELNGATTCASEICRHA